MVSPVLTNVITTLSSTGLSSRLLIGRLRVRVLQGGPIKKEKEMVWVLLWIQVTTTAGVEYFQINSFPKKEECTQALTQAEVMLNHQGEAVICVEVKVK